MVQLKAWAFHQLIRVAVVERGKMVAANSVANSILFSSVASPEILQIKLNFSKSPAKLP